MKHNLSILLSACSILVWAAFAQPLHAQTITINSVGRTVYRTSDPEFSGSVPEPTTVGLLASGLALIAARRLRAAKGL